MPRLPISLIRKAYAIDPLLAQLVRPCRTLGAAQNELRWLREHVDKVTEARRAKDGGLIKRTTLLRELVHERASGKPLQYLLGTEHFGGLEIQCRPGVLVPRQETAASVTHLTHLIRRAQDLPSELRVLDLCTGTGCIPLLFRDEFYSARDHVQLHLLGVDVSPKAFKLANLNSQQVRQNKDYVDRGVTEFMVANVLVNPFADQTRGSVSLKAALNYCKKPPFWDILISNPPYISPSAYWTTTSRSVRGFEPKIALVPPEQSGKTDTEQGDAFYPRLLTHARDLEAKVVLLEVADLDQALRVARMAQRMDIFDGIEIWRDQPDLPDDPSPQIQQDFPIIGQGNGRSVLCWRGLGATWLGKGGREPTVASDAKRLLESHKFSLEPSFVYS